jgi:hypothetical protein
MAVVTTEVSIDVMLSATDLKAVKQILDRDDVEVLKDARLVVKVKVEIKVEDNKAP